SSFGGLRVGVGTTVGSDSVVWQPFASAGVVHEFQGGVTSSLTSNFSAIGLGVLPTLNSTVSTSGLGTYGQFGLGIAAQAKDTGWVGYFRGDYRAGDNIEGRSVNGGLRYQFAPDSAGGQTPVLPCAAGYKALPPPAPYGLNGF